MVIVQIMKNLLIQQKTNMKIIVLLINSFKLKLIMKYNYF
jgi:hypothetical protein